MLKILRKKGVAKKILWGITFVIIISFGLWGQSYVLRQSGRPDYAGKIFGRKISLEEFQRHFELTQAQAMIQYGDEFGKIKEHLNLMSQTWDRIILLYESNRRRIPVSDKEVVEKVQEYPLFQRDKRFDPQLYHNILRYALRLTPRDFEEGIRDNIKFYKLFEKETLGITVTDEEVFQSFQMKNQKVQVSYVLVESDALKSQVALDEVQAKNYYQSHQDEFFVPPTIQVEYLEVPFPEVKSPATLTEAEKDQAFRKALDVSYELKDNPDVAKTAEKFGLKINQTGFFNIEIPDEKLGWTYPAMHQISRLEKGTFSEPIETTKGYQVIRILEKKDAFIPDYAQAKDRVRDVWVNTQALKLSKGKAEEYLKKIQETSSGFKRPDYAKIFKDMGLEIYQTPVFSRGEYLPKIGISRDFQEQAFALTPEQPLSGVVETAKGYAILHLDSQVPVSQEDFNKEKENYKQALLLERKNAIFSEFVTRLRLKANLQDHVSKLQKDAE